MKKLRKNMLQLAFVLCALLLLLIAYGAYTVSVNGNRWYTATRNEYARNKRQNVIPGQILDREGRVLAASDAEGNRIYPAEEAQRRATVHAVGVSAFNMKSSAEYFFSAYLYGAKASFPERLSAALRGEKLRGDTVRLTIDAELSACILSQFPAGKKGAVVVMNYKTGEVLADLSFPNFDPADTASAPEGSSVNRVTQSLTAPGSTFKIVTATAAMRNMADWQDRTFLCTGVLQAGNREITDAGTNRAEGKLTEHGAVTLKKAFALSCNNTFAQAALEMGDQSLRKTAEEFGFNGQFLFRDLVVEDSVYPTLNRTEYEIAMTGIGQSALQVTPLHMCMIAGAVANNGLMMEPWMIREAVTSSGGRRASFSAQSYRQVLNVQEAKVLKEYMRAVITDPSGTGSRANIPGKTVCGKTGTAELDDPKNPGETIVNAWFVGFLDEEDAPYCLAIMVENAGEGGGKAAAPVAKSIFSWLLTHEISP